MKPLFLIVILSVKSLKIQHFAYISKFVEKIIFKSHIMILTDEQVRGIFGEEKNYTDVFLFWVEIGNFANC